MRMSTLFTAVTGLGLLASTASADVLANWTFETSVPLTAGPFLAESGILAATSMGGGFHTSGATAYSNPAGNGSLESFSSNNWGIGDFYYFDVSTVGYQGISISFDQNRSSTGPANFNIDYSLDGLVWNTLGSYTVAVQTWSTGTPVPSNFGPFVAGGDADNQLFVMFRMIATAAGSAAAGTNRIDNVVISGNLVPAPGAIAVLGLAGLVAGRRRRAN